MSAPQPNEVARLGQLWLLALMCSALAVAIGGCEDEDGGELGSAAASARLDAHRDAFASWDRWARRVVAADTVPRSREALRETLFAPVRRDRALVAAWVARQDEPAVSIGPLDAPPADLEWTALEDPRLGRVRVATAELPDRWGGGPAPVPCTVLSRQRDDTTVTAAYRNEAKAE